MDLKIFTGLTWISIDARLKAEDIWGLENLEFVEMLPRLQYLDITGNPVADLTSLEQLQDFQGVWCGETESGGDFFLL